MSSMRAELAAKDADHQHDLTQVRKTAQAETDRAQLRIEAETADLRATISRLEVDLIKVSLRRRPSQQKRQSFRHLLTPWGTTRRPTRARQTT